MIKADENWSLQFFPQKEKAFWNHRNLVKLGFEDYGEGKTYLGQNRFVS